MSEEHHTKEQKLSLLFSAMKTMYIKGDFNNCDACLFLFKETKAGDLKLCDRCSHLYTGDKCKCYREEYLPYYDHTIKTHQSGTCPYCKSENVDYEKGRDNYVKFIIEDIGDMYCNMTCFNCNRKSREYYDYEFAKTVGVNANPL